MNKTSLLRVLILRVEKHVVQIRFEVWRGLVVYVAGAIRFGHVKLEFTLDYDVSAGARGYLHAVGLKSVRIRVVLDENRRAKAARVRIEFGKWFVKVYVELYSKENTFFL